MSCKPMYAAYRLQFGEAADQGEYLGLSDDEVRFYDSLTNNESESRG